MDENATETDWSDDEYYATVIETELITDSRAINDNITDGIPEHPEAYQLSSGTTKIVQNGPDKQQSDFESEDDIPLVFMKKQRDRIAQALAAKRNTLNEESEDSSIYDDADDNDKCYIPSTDESSSDSSCKHSPKKKLRQSRDKPWKKTTTNLKKKNKQKMKQTNKHLSEKLKEKIKNLQSRRKIQNQDSRNIEKARMLSKKMNSLHNYIWRSHLQRLDKLLASNELKRVPVKADGNCFFESIKIALNTPCDNIEIRNKMCDQISNNPDQYIGFFSTNSSERSYSKEQLVLDVETFRNSGNWNNQIGDCLPMAVANVYECTVRIFSSSLSTPVIDVKQTNTGNMDKQKIVCLAHIAVHGKEHYEATRVVKQAMPTARQPIDISSVEGQEAQSTDEVMPSTPHKRANYKSPDKKPSSRKKTKNPSMWKRNDRKRKRNLGLEYTSAHGKTVAAKCLRQHNCEKCRFKCSQKFTEEERLSIFNFYYSLGNYELQRHYICNMVLQSEPIRKAKLKRSRSCSYHLSIDDRKERVCRDFFMNTLDIKRKTIDYAMSKKKHGTYSTTDQRGKSTSSNKTIPALMEGVHAHIKSFPRIESHYSRKNSKREYLAHDLNIKQMYRLYKEESISQNRAFVKESIYRKVFCENYNLSFYKPKKDQCSFCELYKRKKNIGDISNDLEAKYNSHMTAKDAARNEKENDKQKSLKGQDLYVATFDLQAVLTTPCSLVSELYYARKLSCYNLTVYSLSDKQVRCFLWDETQGNRGSCEIATCLLKNTLSVCASSKDIKTIIYYSDTCGGQNRNKFVTASLLYTMTQVPQLKTINHKFLLSGHSQMECDSVHSSIETAKRRTSIFVPSQWSTLVAFARKKNPYIAVPIRFNQVIDFKSFTKKHCLNLKKGIKNENINWLNVKWIQVRQSAPRHVFVNYSFDPTSFIEIDTQGIATRQKRREHSWPKTMNELDFCYSSKLPISVQKKNDLVNLCGKDIIPEDFHAYYTGLQTIKDKESCEFTDSELESEDE